MSLFTSSRDKACKAVQVVSGVELHLQDPDPELLGEKLGTVPTWRYWECSCLKNCMETTLE